MTIHDTISLKELLIEQYKIQIKILEANIEEIKEEVINLKRTNEYHHYLKEGVKNGKKQ